MIEGGDRDLVADPSVLVAGDAFSILSSGQSVLFKSTLGVSLLTKSFETNVWYFILLTLLMIILSSFVHYIWTNKFNKTPRVNKNIFIKVVIKNSFEYSGNLMKQCKFII